jgi:hypothetical protein
MKLFIIIPILALALCSCSEGEKEELSSVSEAFDESVVDSFLEDYGLHPKQKEDINYIRGIMTTDNFQYVFGQKNYNGWICKFDLDGNELQSKELPKPEGWAYSYYGEGLYNDDNFALLSCYYTNSKGIESSSTRATSISVLDLNNLEETEKIEEIHKPQVYKENGRYLITFWWSDMDAKKAYVMGNDGVIKYSLDWDGNKEKFFNSYVGGYRLRKNIMMFLTDEIVAPVLSNYWNGNSASNFEYKIINLKEWELVNTVNIEPRGEHLGENGIVYCIDTTYLDGNNIKYVYRENKTTVDEISGNEELTVLNKYCYHIDADTYEVSYMGKLE